MTLARIAQILDDMFGISQNSVEPGDYLRGDWGFDDIEIAAFDAEFCAEFDVPYVPSGVETIGDYMAIVGV